ncbi:MAG: epoxyqueuosine reductase [Clostridia bacterium]|nr:epoxyqueuosine reductase [Clostridia bacterium]
MLEKEVIEIFYKRGLPVGTCDFEDVSFSYEKTEFKKVFVTLIPYWFKPEMPHNISIYAMLPDYHVVVGELLSEIVSELKRLFPENKFEPHVDVSPINEKKAAVLAGLGFIGKNTLLINKEFGSFLFIGDICTDAEIDLNGKIIPNGCGDCLKCKISCPGKALDSGFDCEKCISAITQKKGELTAEQRDLLRRTKSVWGCDICSIVCPYNQNLKSSVYAEKYKENLLYNLTEDMISGLSNGEFKKRFKERAFAWKGVSVLRRNLEAVKYLD